MKFQSFILICCIIITTACNNSSGENNAAANSGTKNVTTIQWIDSARNYGSVVMGQKLAVAFRFRNSGNNPLIIESVRPGCGCTVADYPKEAIAPGQEAEITGVFDSHDREGYQHKEITVKANTPTAEQNISFDVNVVRKAGIPDTEEQ
jgi:hypothetical protein